MKRFLKFVIQFHKYLKFTSLYLKLQIYKIVRLQKIPTEYQTCMTPVSADFREIKYSLHNYVIYNIYKNL